MARFNITFMEHNDIREAAEVLEQLATRTREVVESARNGKLEGTDSWSRSTFIENGGWAQTPGATSISTAVSGACAKLLLKKQS